MQKNNLAFLISSLTHQVFFFLYILFFLTSLYHLEDNKTSTFELKLLDLNVEPLAVFDTEAKAVVRLSSAEFARICRDLGTIGDTVVIDAQKDAVSFSVVGDELSGSITLKPSEAADVCHITMNSFHIYYSSF